MKRTLKSIIAASVLAICLTGCEKEIFSSFSEIKFKAGTVSDPQTKTEYGKRVGSVQMVDWRAGDLVRITSAQAAQDTMSGTIHYADYVVQSDGTQDGSSARSVSRISAQNRGLHWGSKDSTHIFYSVYPSPGTRGKSSDALDEYGAMRGNIPATQAPLSVSSSAPYVAGPDMIHQYMVAKRTVPVGTQTIGENEVFLYYTPITTAIEFEVTNGMTDTLAISSIDLISASHNLSGTFTCSLKGLNESGGTYPTVTASSGASNTASVSFGSLKLADNQKLTFTIFLLPEDNLNDLTFRINKTDGKYIQAALKSDDSGNPFITFARCKKHFVKGLFVNEGATWTLCFAPGVSSWIENEGDDRTLDDPAATGNPNLVSWDEGSDDELNLKKPVEYLFKLEKDADATKIFSDPSQTSSYSIPVISEKTDVGVTDEDHGWKIKSYKAGSGSPVSVTGDTFTIDGLTVAKNGRNLKVTDKRTLIDKASHDYWAGNNGNWSPAAKTTTVDLSKYDFEADQTRTTMRTANCYVIRHAGTYRIPLVYGNAIDEVAVSGGTNSAAYAGVSGGLNPFVNSRNKAINDPFIENHTYDGNAIASNHKTDLVATSASVVWQDEAAVISNVSIYTPSTGQKNAGSYNKSNVRYIEFTVNSSNIRQNNAVIAVYGRDKDGKNEAAILWSWHIWITNDPGLLTGSIPVTNATSKTYNFFPLPCLGWIEPPYYEVKDDVVVTLQQEESDETLTVTIKRPTYHYPGNGTYYQYGRKDPMPRKDALVGGSESTITRTNVASTSGVIIGVSIWHPQTFYWSSNGDFGNWSQTKYYNLWTGKYNSSGTSVDNNSTTMIKTVYDPCPVGYKVPASKAFTAFATLPSTPMTELNGFTFQAGDRTIFFPACGMRTYKTTDFGISGGATYNGGDVARVGLNAYYVTAISSDTSADFDDEAYKVFTFGFNKNSITTENKNARANGMSVRPVKE